jgi:hypothetical protein
LARASRSRRWEAIRTKLRTGTYDANWEAAIAGIEGRFKERFIQPADAIQELDKNDSLAFPEGRGFAIVALDCLLLESLYGYETGERTSSSRATTAAFENMLTSKVLFMQAFAPRGLAASFGRAVRNGLLHDDETRGGWIIWRGTAGGPLVQRRPDNRLVLYRDAFHAAVKASFAEYFATLRGAQDSDGLKLRKAFIDRVNALCKESEPNRRPT